MNHSIPGLQIILELCIPLTHSSPAQDGAGLSDVLEQHYELPGNTLNEASRHSRKVKRSKNHENPSHFPSGKHSHPRW